MRRLEIFLLTYLLTEDVPVLDRPAPLRRLHDSGAGYKISRLTYLLTDRRTDSSHHPMHHVYLLIYFQRYSYFAVVIATVQTKIRWQMRKRQRKRRRLILLLSKQYSSKQYLKKNAIKSCLQTTVSILSGRVNNFHFGLWTFRPQDVSPLDVSPTYWTFRPPLWSFRSGLFRPRL